MEYENTNEQNDKLSQQGFLPKKPMVKTDEDEQAQEQEAADRVSTNKLTETINNTSGKIGWAILWLLGVPIPVLLGLFLLRGCT